MTRIARIFIYPIKSTAPVELQSAAVHERGLQYDRRYVVTDSNGRFLTARRFPRMVLIRSQMKGNALEVTAPDMTALALDPAGFPERYDAVKIWKDEVWAQRCGAAADAWFSTYLAADARLYHMDAQAQRPTRAGGQVSFADSAPLLVLSEASVADLNARLDEPVSVRNFRPNLVVSGADAYAEDQFTDFTAGTAGFKALWRCSRCVLTTVNPDTGVNDSGRQPLKTLMDYRRDGDDALFGLNVGVAAPGHITVGDELKF